MPITVGALKADRRTVDITYGSEEVRIVYKPSAWTPETEDLLQQAMEEEGANSTPVLERLSELIVSWDVFDDDNEPYDPTVENMRKLPSAFTTTCTRAIMEDMLPGEAQRSSAGGSRRRG